MRLLLITIIALCHITVYGGEIALTFDDAPRKGSRLFNGEERTQKLIESLQKVDVADVLVFIKTGNVTATTSKRLEAYVKAGFHLGNHSHNHYSAHNQSIETYLDDITEAQEVLKGFKNVVPYYRYPYLHEGKTRDTRDRIRQHLKKSGYKNGYVTIDNYDWYMDSLLQKAIADGKKVNYEALKQAYIRILWDAIRFYDEIAKKALGRSPKHILLLHENDLAALFIDDLVEHIRAQGWSIISPLEAFDDPVADMVPDVLFNGQGRVAAIARSKGWGKKLLIDKSSNEVYLDKYFEDNKVFE